MTAPNSASDGLFFDRVVKSFGGTQALRGVSLRVGRGEIVACKPITLGYQQNGMPRARLGNRKKTQKELLELAALDGFTSSREMLEWFEETYGSLEFAADGGRDVFYGFLTTWVLEA